MKPAGAPCVCLCTRARVCEYMCVCVRTNEIPSSPRCPHHSSPPSLQGVPGIPLPGNKTHPPPGPPICHVRAYLCACTSGGGVGWGGARASLFRESAKETVEKYHNKSVLEGEAAVLLFRWLIYGRRGLHIKTVCETSSVDTN